MGQFFGLGSALISEEFSWRIAFICLGAPGFFVAIVLALSVREPQRGLSEILAASTTSTQPTANNREHLSQQPFISNRKDTPHSDNTISVDAYVDHDETTVGLRTLKNTLKRGGGGFIRRIQFLLHLPTFICHCIVATIRNMGGYALGAWLQVFLVREYGIHASTYTPWLIVIIPVGMYYYWLNSTLSLFTCAFVRTFINIRWSTWGTTWRVGC